MNGFRCRWEAWLISTMLVSPVGPVGISFALSRCSHSENINLAKTGNKSDERYRVQASAFGGCLYRGFIGRRIGAGANTRRNVALCDRRIGQYARSEHSGVDPRSLRGESEHLRPAGFLRPQTAQRKMGV